MQFKEGNSISVRKNAKEAVFQFQSTEIQV